MTATITLHHGNCVDVLAGMPDASVDAVVTDPPYGLANTDPQHVADTIVRWVNGDRDYIPEGAGFMGKAWDAFVPPVAVWDECLRVLKPGGHVLTFAGSRTVDLMTLGLRLAGFEIRDSIAWLYGTGFPKSLDVSKAIDKAEELDSAAAQVDRRPPLTPPANGKGGAPHSSPGSSRSSSAANPSWARSPRTSSRTGPGALNVDGCRIETTDNLDGGGYAGELRRKEQYTSTTRTRACTSRLNRGIGEFVQPSGRWPANVVLDEDMAGVLDEQSGTSLSARRHAAGRGRSARRVLTPSRPSPT